MSIDVLIYLKPERMPTPQEWQKAITERGFPVLIDTDFDTASFTGYLPGEYKGEPCGFEYYAFPFSTDDCREEGIPHELSLCVGLVTHGDHLDGCCSTIAGAVLAEMTEGIFDQTDAINGRWRGEDAVYYARKLETWEEDHKDYDSEADYEEDYGGRTPLSRPELSFERNVVKENVAESRRQRLMPTEEPPPSDRSASPDVPKRPWWKFW